MNLTQKRLSTNKSFEIDITSLLDILVILLFFLLQNFRSTEYKITLKNKISLAASPSKETVKKNILIQIDKNLNLFFNNKRIGNLIKNNKFVLIQIDELLKRRNLQKDEKEDLNGHENKKIRMNLNLVIDKNIQYTYLKKVTNIINRNNFSYNFLVQGYSE